MALLGRWMQRVAIMAQEYGVAELRRRHQPTWWVRLRSSSRTPAWGPQVALILLGAVLAISGDVLFEARSNRAEERELLMRLDWELDIYQGELRSRLRSMERDIGAALRLLELHGFDDAQAASVARLRGFEADSGLGTVRATLGVVSGVQLTIHQGGMPVLDEIVSGRRLFLIRDPGLQGDILSIRQFRDQQNRLVGLVQGERGLLRAQLFSTGEARLLLEALPDESPTRQDRRRTQDAEVSHLSDASIAAVASMLATLATVHVFLRNHLTETEIVHDRLHTVLGGWVHRTPIPASSLAPPGG